MSLRVRSRVQARLGRLAAALLQLSPGLAWTSPHDAIVLYTAYGSRGSATIEGRVIERKSSPEPSEDDGRRSNLRRNLGLLINDERAGRPVRVCIGEQLWEAVTDEEGYFRIEATRLDALAHGWHPVLARSGEASVEGALLLIPDGAVHGVISDLDDTILVSEVNSTRRMLRSALLRNPLQREAVAGSAKLYASLAARNADPASAPIFYLSGSPRQLYSSIELFLRHNGYPRGVVIAKRVTDDETSEPLRDQVLYKSRRIAEIFAAAPDVRYTLIGDDTERDPEIYREVQRLHPGRVDAIWIRRVNPDPARPRLPGQGNLDDLLREHR